MKKAPLSVLLVVLAAEADKAKDQVNYNKH